ncbi:MAG: hypothetical protein J7K62_01420 [Thermoplasmata archaeon]|nr:hypothetical protein [Thermoplasmata archaeon]
MKLRNMKSKAVCIAIVFTLLSSAMVSATMVNMQRSTNIKLEEKQQQQMVRAVFTIHRLGGKQKIIRYISKEKIKELRTNNFNTKILKEICPPEVKAYLDNEFNSECEKLAGMTLDEISTKYPSLKPILRKIDLPTAIPLRDLVKENKKLSTNNEYNILCLVSGGGWGAIFPPYLPITPILIAGGYLAFTIDGLLGSGTYLATEVICIPFIGVSLFIPPLELFVAGLAGVTLVTILM